MKCPKCNKEIGIFEDAQQAQAHNNRYDEPDFLPQLLLCLADGKTAAVEHQNGCHHQHHIFRLTPAIEDQAEQQQNRVLQAPGHRKIHDQYCRQEIKKKIDEINEDANL